MTGSSGFIGTSLKKRLEEENDFQVYGISRSSTVTPNTFKGDLTDGLFITRVIKEVRPDYIVHLAGSRLRTSDFASHKSLINDNVLTTFNLLESISRISSIKRIIVLGTAEEYGNGPVPCSEDQRESPVSGYSFSKVCCSHLCADFHRSNGTPLLYFRPTVCYGPGQANDMFLPDLIITLSKGRSFRMTAGFQKRDFLFIDDLVEAIIAGLTRDSVPYDILNIGSGKSVLLRDVALKVARLLNAENLLELGAVPYRENEIMDYSVDISKVKKVLGWEPKTEFDAGIVKTIASYMAG